MNNPASLSRSKALNLGPDPQPLEIKSIIKEDEHTVTLSPCNISLHPANNITGHKDAFDFLPKNLVKQMNEKKLLSFNNTSNSTGLTATNATLAAVATNGFQNSSGSLNNLMQISDMNVSKRSYKYVRNTPGSNIISSNLSQNTKINAKLPSASSIALNDQKTEDSQNQSIGYNIPSTTPNIQLNHNTKAQLDKVVRSTLTRQKVLK